MSLFRRLGTAVRQDRTQVVRLPAYFYHLFHSSLERGLSGKMLKKRPENGALSDIARDLLTIGYEPQVWKLDQSDFFEFFHTVDYEKRNYYPTGTAYIWEKSLEHYISIRMLDLQAEDVVIDVASDRSVFPDIVKELYGVRTAYRQDLKYKSGVHDDRIGGDASDMPIPAGFATKLVLHSAFEHFEGDTDTGFVIEAARVLKSGGRFVIIPLFVGLSYYYQSSFFRSRRGLEIDPDAKWWLEWTLLQRHSRYYDIAHLKSRVLDHCQPFKIDIYQVPQVTDIDPICDCNFVLVGTRL